MELPGDTQLRWTIDHMARLLDVGAEPVRGLVLPDGSFFPDRFDGTPASIGALYERIVEHAGLSHLKSDLTVVTDEGKAVSCSSGGCGGPGDIDVRLTRVKRIGERYAVTIPAAEVGHPVVLTTGLARAVATMFLLEADGYAAFDPREAEPVTDLAAVMLGFGVLAANGGHVYMKGCGGGKVHSATKLPLEQLVVALALFCGLYEGDASVARRHLEPAQREAFDVAAPWARANTAVVRMLRDNRTAIAANTYRLAPAHGWLSRLLGLDKKKKALDTASIEDVDDLERVMTEGGGLPKKRRVDPAKQKRLDELKALVDESL